MKRRGVGRRQVLDLNNKKANSPSRQNWQTKYQQICIDHNSQNGSVNDDKVSPSTTPPLVVQTELPSGGNSLSGLIGSYHSDSESDDNANGEENPGNLDSKVADFLKEIQEIAPLDEPKQSETQVQPSVPQVQVQVQAKTHPIQYRSDVTAEQIQYTQQQAVIAATPQPTIAWQECYDENTGYTYYWNMHTNEVTWEMPGDYQQYRIALEQWQAAQQHMQMYTMNPVISSEQRNPSANGAGHDPVSTKDQVSVKKFDKKPVGKKRNYPHEASDSEDERIEMITSYGSYSGDETDSDDDGDGNNASKKKKIVKSPSPPKRKIIKKDKEKRDKSKPIEKPVAMGPQLPKHLETNDQTGEFGPQLPPDYLLKAEGNVNSPNSPALASLVAYGPDVDNYDDDDNADEDNFKQSSVEKNSLMPSVKDNSHSNKEISVTSVGNKIKTKIKDGSGKKIEDKQEEMLIIDSQSDARSTLALKKLKKLKHKAENNTDDSSSDSSSDPDEKIDGNADEDDDEDEIDESVIISRLRSQANILKELGGEIPDSIKELIAEDRPSSFSLIAGYGDDSDMDEEDMELEKEDHTIGAKTKLEGDETQSKGENQGSNDTNELVKTKSDSTSDGEVRNKSSNEASLSKASGSKLSRNAANLKIIKLSARAKALINASITTARARATNFVRTADGLKPADLVKEIVEKKDQPEAVISSAPVSTATSETKIPKQISDTKMPKQTSDTKMPKQTKKLSAKVPDKNVTVNPLIACSSNVKNVNSNVYASYWASAQSGTERRGLGYSTIILADEEKAEQPIPHSKKGMIQFVKGEPEIITPTTASVNNSTQELKGDTGKSKPTVEMSEKEIADIKDLAVTIKEKVHFLSEAKEPVSPVQEMSIQLETLMTAWEDGSLAVHYLSKWLKSTDNQLKSLEEAAAPEQWSCHWDRLHKRYYYCHLETNVIQWEYPQVSVTKAQNQNTEGEAMELCTTPPHPSSSSALSASHTDIVQEETPPSPPIISEGLSQITSETDNSVGKADSYYIPSPPPPPSIKVKSPPLPPIPSLPPLPPDPPLPPPSSPPPLPPPLPPSSASSEIILPVHSIAHGEPLPPGVDLPERSFYGSQPPPPPVPAPVPPPPPPESPPPLPPPPPAISPPLPPVPPPSDSLAYSAPISHYQTPAVYHHSTVSMENYTQPYTVAQPPAESNLALELDSFYSDIAALEPTPNVPSEPPPLPVTTSLPLPVPPPPGQTDEISIDNTSSASAPVTKKKKKTKLTPGLSLKMKGVSSLVAKWQQVQEDVRRDMKSPESEKISHR